MTGVDIIGALLLTPEPIEGVAVGSIKADLLPDGTPNPSLLVRTVSRRDELPTLVRKPDARQVERVSVAVRANSRGERITLVDRISDRCAGVIGTVMVDEVPVRGVSVLAAGIGPSVIGPGSTFEQTIDLRVSFLTPAQPGV